MNLTVLCPEQRVEAAFSSEMHMDNMPRRAIITALDKIISKNLAEARQPLP